ncbi:MAG: Nif3-like dinuclear metal center hexameric protein [Gammaproteobacteria bacterium]|jgi:dinuclear metal center YbgI/SA1388 family protein|nr:Nif3-like dinuclear metal center hexameric protein [Gammaproteobacteria bacterium]MBT3490123.1 Nif3-like dinuclear metal center hexameric protein [Gammaproteobacteria bacterium]MBT3717300.1 Nif3-like dinuclear metal center hexameric protein [Gammaproteobacteria bacterium]MBT3844591.1 Nif3-like dinuclear metal center hexameric protein [Gammaproteobacteria bacterium]MBT3891899.1 Nif3-like dinuclear metal center hexameric protein [Gammaproteobacteria bacterium]
MRRNQLVESLNALLEIDRYRDYAPNGLQVEGRDEINTIVTAVTASQNVIDAAIERKADLLLVHHGYFWKGEELRIVGLKQQRLKKLLEHEINLVAYHLPLDGHIQLGNNAQWGQRLGCEIKGTLEQAELVCQGEFEQPLTLDQLSEKVAAGLEGRPPLVIAGHQHPIQRIGWCSGGAQDYLVHAAEAGLDAYLSGEVSERTYHEAMELGICYLACGHHATERGGVMALGEWVREQYGLECHFIDESNPV